MFAKNQFNLLNLKMFPILTAYQLLQAVMMSKKIDLEIY